MAFAVEIEEGAYEARIKEFKEIDDGQAIDDKIGIGGRHRSRGMEVALNIFSRPSTRFDKQRKIISRQELLAGRRR